MTPDRRFPPLPSWPVRDEASSFSASGGELSVSGADCFALPGAAISVEALGGIGAGVQGELRFVMQLHAVDSQARPLHLLEEVAVCRSVPPRYRPSRDGTRRHLQQAKLLTRRLPVEAAYYRLTTTV
jgi:hypothetical protein